MAKVIADPLFGPSPTRIQLKNPPLASVLIQIRFSELYSIKQKEHVAPFQELVRESYPLAQDEQTFAINVANGAPGIAQSVIWRFSAADKSWRVSLAPDFLALETTKYVSRQDFHSKLSAVLTALATTVRPDLAIRVGIRFVNRVVEPETEMLQELFCPELASFSSSPLRTHIKHSLTEALCNTQEGQILLRWGWMPAGSSHDPGMLPPIQKMAWILDIDSFHEYLPNPVVFSVEELSKVSLALATRADTFFRWSAKEKLFDVYGVE